MTISVVIPHVPSIGADDYLSNLIKQLKPQVDEIKIVENSGAGYGASVNKGLSEVTGDFLIVSNNDISILYGDVKDLCHPGYVTVPDIVPRPRDYNPRCFFCMERHIYETIRVDGYYFYDERFFPGYFEDDDLVERLLDNDFATLIKRSVRIEHFNGGGHTMKQFGEQESFDRNKKLFEEKWSR